MISSASRKHFVLGMLLAVGGNLGNDAEAQDSHFLIPSPESYLRPVENVSEVNSARQSMATSNDQEAQSLQLPIISSAPVLPVAMSQFTPGDRIAQLRRGNTVYEISNQAFRESGVLDQAVKSNPELAAQYQVLQARTMQREQAAYRVSAGRTMNGAQMSAAEKDAANVVLGNTVAAQQAAAQAFENTLWTEGFNGAKVAAVNDASQPRRTKQNFVLLSAIGEHSRDNLGYSYTQVTRTGEFGATYVPSEYLLPLPVDANDVFFSPLLAATHQRAPDGVMFMLSEDQTKNPILQTLALPRFGIHHDTGFVPDGKTSFAERVSLLSRKAPPAGQTFFLQNGSFEVPVDLGMNAEVLDLGGGTTGQFFVTANNDTQFDQLDLETIGVRAYVRERGSFFEGWSITAGAKQSLFGAIDLRPQGLDGNSLLIGTVDRSFQNIPQLSVGAPLTQYWHANIGIEQPILDDMKFTAANGFTRLSRWPTLASNLTWIDPCTANQILFGSILRTIGYEVDGTTREHFTTGYGVSAIASIKQGNSKNFFGIAGGDGVGDYIRGVSVSALGSPQSIQTVSGMGAFLGRHTLFLDRMNNPVGEMNFAYGYSYMETPAGLANDVNGKLHHVRANYFHFLNERVGLGGEYQYGFRKVLNGDTGEDHRFFFLLAVRTGKVAQSTRVGQYISNQSIAQADAMLSEGGLDADRPIPPLPPEAKALYSTDPIAATLDGQSVESVVRQTQFGGPAFRQRF